MKGSSKRFISLVLSLGLLFGSIILFLFFLKPAYSKVNILRSEYSANKSAIASQEQVVAKVKDVLSNYQDQLVNLEKNALNIVPKNPEYETFLYQINAISKIDGILLASLDFNLLPNKSAKGKDFTQNSILQVKLQLKGQYDKFKSFISHIEKNMRLIDVVSMNIIPDEKGNNSYSVVLNTYYTE